MSEPARSLNVPVSLRANSPIPTPHPRWAQPPHPKKGTLADLLSRLAKLLLPSDRTFHYENERRQYQQHRVQPGLIRQR